VVRAQIADQRSQPDLPPGRDQEARSPDQGHRHLQEEIAALRARQQAVEDLQADRNLPVHLLNELVRQLPDGVYLTSMKQDNQTWCGLTGIAQSNERVSELLRNLGSTAARGSRSPS
jgi:type IV pilus assembly protein PilN